MVALEKRVIRYHYLTGLLLSGTCSDKPTFTTNATEALAIDAGCRNKFRFHWLDGRDDNGDLISTYNRNRGKMGRYFALCAEAF